MTADRDDTSGVLSSGTDAGVISSKSQSDPYLRGLAAGDTPHGNL